VILAQCGQGRLVGIAELSRPPRYCVFRPGTKSFLLADVVSSRRAVDRSSNQPVVRCEASIGIISIVLRDNTQAIGSTRGRPVWLRCHRLTDLAVGVRRCATRAHAQSFTARHGVFPACSDAGSCRAHPIAISYRIRSIVHRSKLEIFTLGRG
jgi:hypothetical protein